MKKQLLDIKVKCQGDNQCLFEGEDLLLDIIITNNQNEVIGFPLEYMRERGPAIKLIDSRTKAEQSLMTKLADWELKEKFTLIKPGESLSISWIIFSSEIQYFGINNLDLSAVITIMVDIKVRNKIVTLLSSDSIQIVSKY